MLHKETNMLSLSATEKNIDSYEWYKYDGRKHAVQFKDTKRNVMPGDIIGIRYGTRSHSSKAFIAFADNPKTDFSVTDRVADNIIKKSKKVKLKQSPRDLLKASKSKRVSSQHDSAYVASSAWDARLFKPQGRLPSPKRNGYSAKDFQWKAVIIPQLTVSKTRAKKHTFQKGEWVGLRYDSASRGGTIVDTRGIIFNVSAEAYGDIADNTALVEKNKWPDFHYSPDHIERMSEERHEETKQANANKRKQATAERNKKVAADAADRLARKRAKIREEAELANKRGEYKKSERTMRAREDLGLNKTPNEAFDAFLRGNILDDFDDDIDYDLGDENSDIGLPVEPDAESDEDIEEEDTGEDAEGEEGESEEDLDYEMSDADEDLGNRESDGGDSLLDSLDDEIDKTREALEDAVESDEDLDTDTSEEDEDDLDEDELDEDDGADEDDDFDSEEDEGDAEDDDGSGTESTSEGEDEDADEGDEEDEDEDADEGDEEDEDEDADEGDEEDEDADEDEGDEDAGDEEDADTGSDDGDDPKKDEDGKGNKPKPTETEENTKPVEVGDILTFKADESEQRQFLVFEIVPGKNNPEVENYLLYDIKGGSNKYNIFRSSKNAKTKIEQHTNVLRRASGSELRKVYKKANDLVLDREAIIS